MTLLFGAFALRQGETIPEATRSAIDAALPQGAGEVRRAVNPRLHLSLLETGAFAGEVPFADGPGVIAALSGEALLERAGLSRLEELHTLADALATNALRVVAGARGTFAGVVHHPHTGRLHLFTDRLGVRPLYVVEYEGCLYFASQEALLRRLPSISLSLDERGVAETLALGYPLSDRTSYRGVQRLLPAELLRSEGERIQRLHYWKWDEVGTSDRPRAELAAEVHATFREGVRRRLGADRHVTAFLSGGLDSRCVVSELRAAGARVRTVNFSFDRTLDQMLAAEFARAAGTEHEEFSRRTGRPDWSSLMATALANATQASGGGRTRLVWSGDGGSVGLGYVYLSAGIAAAMREQRREDAARQFLAKQGSTLPRRLFRGALAAVMADAPEHGVLEELARLSGPDPVRVFHQFLLQNDQRRHLDRHFASIERSGIELQLPFYDAEFASRMATVPPDACLGHAFYMEVLGHFPPVVRRVPWQAYPGHAPCPLPLPDGARQQWDPDFLAEKQRSEHRYLRRRGREILTNGSFPRGIMRRSFLAAAWLAHSLRVRDTSHVLSAAVRVAGLVTNPRAERGG